ncbi:MAG: DUF2000 domain-containing protein [Candidatus Gottesmanbacteria bacterium]|nr:DUF2000 domain-containing protein [Candidatus Gottesmanbacteria bacterium]
MNTNPTTHKFVAVLNKKIETGKLMNALGHMTAGLSALVPDKEAMRFDSYRDKDGGVHPSISDNPFIIVSSDNSNQIRTLRNALKEHSIPFTDFTNTMTVGTFVEQKQRTSETVEVELEYYGICFFGDRMTLSELTKKFSLWR